MSRPLGLAVAWCVLILAACAIPGDSFGDYKPVVFSFDKLGHMALFVVFGRLWLSALPGRYVLVLVWGVAFSFASEAWQSLLPFDRVGDLYDALADVAGVVLGVAWGAWRERTSTSRPSNVRAGGVS